jgi:plasmid stabilization system protein ParE
LKRLPVRWTAPAYADLFEILEFVGAGRPAAARRLGRELLSQSKALKNNALRGRMVPEAVQISAIIDASRDVGEVLLQRFLR